MEASMRHPFYMDHLSPEDQRTVKKWYGGIFVIYSTLILLVFATFLIRDHSADSPLNASRCRHLGVVPQANGWVGASPATAAEADTLARRSPREPASSEQCD
jgi:hypothetical protein